MKAVLLDLSCVKTSAHAHSGLYSSNMERGKKGDFLYISMHCFGFETLKTRGVLNKNTCFKITNR